MHDCKVSTFYDMWLEILQTTIWFLITMFWISQIKWDTKLPSIFFPVEHYNCGPLNQDVTLSLLALYSIDSIKILILQATTVSLRNGWNKPKKTFKRANIFADSITTMLN